MYCEQQDLSASWKEQVLRVTSGRFAVPRARCRQTREHEARILRGTLARGPSPYTRRALGLTRLALKECMCSFYVGEVTRHSLIDISSCCTYWILSRSPDVCPYMGIMVVSMEARYASSPCPTMSIAALPAGGHRDVASTWNALRGSEPQSSDLSNRAPDGPVRSYGGDGPYPLYLLAQKM